MSECIINNKTVDKLMLGYLPTSSVQYNFDFFRWKLNPSLPADAVEISQYKIVIKKFKPNVYILMTNETDKTPAHLCELLYGQLWTTTGITQLVEDGTLTPNSSGTWGGGGTYYGEGLHVGPYNMNGAGLYAYQWPWEIGISNGSLKYDNTKGYAHFGYWADVTRRNIFNITGFKTGKECGYRDQVDYNGVLYLFSGNKDVVGSDGLIDISDRPITIQLDYKYELSAERTEVWDMYDNNDNLIYHKDKTFENCWKEYGFFRHVDEDDILKQPYDYITTNAHTYKLPDIIDWDSIDYFNYEKEYTDPSTNTQTGIIHMPLRLRDCFIYNTDFYDKWKEYIKNHPITNSVTRLCHYSNINGTLVVNIGDSWNPYSDVISLEHLAALTNITAIEIYHKGNARLGSLNKIFFRAQHLTSIKCDKTVLPNDMSGCFDFCVRLESYPSNFISYAEITEHRPINISFCWEEVGLKEVPSYNTSNRFAENNTIYSIYYANQAFNQYSTTSLTKVGPVIDCRYVKSSNRMFLCPSMVDIRIKNLNHKNWKLDENSESSDGYMPNLNSDSVKYLFNNLYDLTSGEGLDLQDNQNTSIPAQTSANLYCPAEWSDKITSDMITAANAKGWSIYIGGTLQTTATV